MSAQNQTKFHSVDEEWLASYTAGSLSPLKRLVIDCQADVQPQLASRLGQLDAVGGAFLETAPGNAVSGDFMSRLTDAIDGAETATDAGLIDETQPVRTAVKGWTPAPLLDFLEHADIPLNWRKAGPGVERAPLVQEGEERLYLLKAKPGLKLPMHTHQGEEWTLILQGGYHVGDKGYVRGDLHREDATCTHQPIIDDDGEACISLVVDEGRLRFTDPIMTILQPIIGI